MITIKDKPGCITVEEMRHYFEKSIKETALLAANTPLGAMVINGKFSHYVTPDTDTMWIGFALGMRAAERVASQTSGDAS
ncbi:hypothetical protein PHO31112_00743 [Pandoraea horticolens]|uniref:Uncharacterized protein n=1 Tax=Pandoraea horticolens TaxID=2508298 RepID=A0A5E4SET4_9BURK|nr:hypothetical protein [Pandoraea horticolens]VVD74167.1 hypothetical protein PHO31112_00743 [Pandoraea horticolens]